MDLCSPVLIFSLAVMSGRRTRLQDVHLDCLKRILFYVSIEWQNLLIACKETKPLLFCQIEKAIDQVPHEISLKLKDCRFPNVREMEVQSSMKHLSAFSALPRCPNLVKVNAMIFGGHNEIYANEARQITLKTDEDHEKYKSPHTAWRGSEYGNSTFELGRFGFYGFGNVVVLKLMTGTIAHQFFSNVVLQHLKYLSIGSSPADPKTSFCQIKRSYNFPKLEYLGFLPLLKNFYAYCDESRCFRVFEVLNAEKFFDNNDWLGYIGIVLDLKRVQNIILIVDPKDEELAIQKSKILFPDPILVTIQFDYDCKIQE